MNPTFCTYRNNPGLADSYFSGVAASHGLGDRRPGLAVSAIDEQMQVIVAADGRSELVPRALVDLALAEAIALDLMDAMEEAIEDAIDRGQADRATIDRLENNLALMERVCEGG